MKRKILLFAMFALGLHTASAQLPNGSTAPNFTATDLNGNTHQLSEYLAAGKSVILNFSSTWCDPCWNLHTSQALEDLYYSYGAGGSNEVVILLIEGDPQTTVAHLQGTGGRTRGDWTQGTSFPIINSSTIANQYQINFFPTLMRICPSGIVTQIEATSASQFRNSINNNCGVTLNGIQNSAAVRGSDYRFCEVNGNAIEAQIKNIGKNTMLSANIALKKNGVTVATQAYNGSLNQYGQIYRTFTGINIDPAAQYSVQLTSINGTPPTTAAIATKNYNFGFPTITGSELEVRVFTDNFPGEISWRIKDFGGVTVASGGPYQGNENGGGGPDANTTKIHNISLPEFPDCYTVELLDSYADGWGNGSTPHGIQIVNNGNVVFERMVGSFFSVLSIPAALKTTEESLSTSDPVTNTQFAIYPNPSTGIFNLHTTQTVSVRVSDMTGKIVFSSARMENGAVLQLSGLQKGMYFAKVSGDSFDKVVKLILN